MNNYANAQNLASYGRGNDTQLVHMTPGEVKGLQALALAHGGSLTINPDTGLPEAFFLERILPMIAGAALTATGVGAPLAALMVGGGYGLATGSMEKGLMAGLGAYGGAGLTSSLASLGSEAGRTAAEGVATEGYKTAADEAIKSGLGNQAMDASRGMIEPQASQILETAQNYINPQNFPGLSPEQIQASQAGLPEAIRSGSSPEQYMGSLGRASATQGAPAGVTASNVAAGLKEVGTSLPAAGQFASSNIGTIGSAALPLLVADQQTAGPAGYQEDEYDRRLKGYRLSPDYQPYVAPRPNPYYKATYAAEGGVMESFDDETGTDTVGMASGGIARYRSKGQVNVLQDYIDRQDKEERQQKHLSTNPSSYFPDVGIFRDPDVDTARKDALTASMIRLGKASKGAGIKTVALPKTSIRGLGDIRGATPEIEEAADGGIMRYNLGGYSDGGRMLKGPGDGMSDSIPASIAGKQPARLADGEFVVPADVVSHLGNGSTDAGAKKLYGMMDNIRKARTGKKKQAPQVNVDKYLPGKKKASGGIAGYASGGVIGYAEGGNAAKSGDIAGLYKSVLNRDPDPEGLAAWQKALDTGTSFSDIERMFKDSQEARTNTIKKIYNEQLGREAEAEGLANWLKVYNSGQTAEQISKSIATAKEGQDMDIQSAASAYRKVLGRNPEPEGLQFWLSLAQSEGLTNKQLMDRIAEAAAPEMKARNITKPFTEMELEALGANPYAGYYSEKSIYDIAPDAKNISMIGDRQVQFRTPVTQQAVVSQFINGIYTAKQGLDMLNTPDAIANLNVALANGALSKKDYDGLVDTLNNSADDPAAVRAALASPKARVIIDAAYGQQIAEATTEAEAKREAALRQAELTGIDPGYYLSNRTLTDAYKKAGVSIPFEYDFFKGVDTRDRESVMVTPENFLDKKNELINAIKTNPYRAQYDQINQPKTSSLAPIRDPYSDEGLKILYGRMMDQYGTPTTGLVNPAVAPTTPYTYKPPVPQRLLDEQKARADYDAKVAADKLAYDKAPITEKNFDAAAYLRAYPEVANPAVWARSPYEHYLTATTTPGGNTGDYFKATRLPFTPTPFVAAPLFGPGSAGTPAPAPVAAASDAAAPVPNKAGGLMAINRKKQAKTKPRKGLLAA